MWDYILVFSITTTAAITVSDPQGFCTEIKQNKTVSRLSIPGSSFQTKFLLIIIHSATGSQPTTFHMEGQYGKEENGGKVRIIKKLTEYLIITSSFLSGFYLTFD